MDLLYFVVFILGSPFLLYRMIAQGRYRRGWSQRLWRVPQRHSDQPCIWIHGVSMGEINAARTLIDRLEAVLPGHEIVISSTTDTGITRAEQVYGSAHRVFFFPWDFSFAVGRALDRLSPQLCVMMEGEVWPNFLQAAQRRNIPVAVVNARIGSGKGWPRYRRLARLFRPIFSRLTSVMAQDDVAAHRFEYLGVNQRRIQVTGSLKYDTAEVVDRVAGTDELAQQLGLNKDEMVWVAGQTGPEEEAIVLQAYDRLRGRSPLKSLRLVIVPRKPERFDEVARLIEGHPFPLVRYSQIKNQAKSADLPPDAVILGDTMGDLRKFYSLSTAVFVGRSLVPMGGSDVMEVAALGRAVVVGPHTENFSETVKALRDADGLDVVHNVEELSDTIARLLLDSTAAQQKGQNARRNIIDHQGATERTVRGLLKLIGYRPPWEGSGIATLIEQ